MNKLLQLKHWQLFILLVGMPIALQIASAIAVIASGNVLLIMYIFPVVMILYMAVFFGWFYALGTGLHKKLPYNVTMNVNRFKLFLLIPVIYISLLCIFMGSVFSHAIAYREPPQVSGWIALVIPVHFFAIFCIFYCIYFVAKALKAVELQRPVMFSDYVGEFFLFWFFIVGIWILQPRINKIFDGTKEMMESLLS